ncbi:type II toxin-antitoxin system PemK/MazF family toxin [Lactiplantibacillus herbarum]|uniref:type II toxin-antitoxin system PemK/MazF family toxin n=1 Tax=Lactiplantibacillus herbarum TaxID=1670446 RepID=UPI00064E39B9|nr:type II toxin-antitoxin system PemK/MazF family toxin [Lactiplantibacillus herbarum]
MKFQLTKLDYTPEIQDLIWLDFDPATGHEIKKRRPALVLSSSGYSHVSKLAVVTPITHANRNAQMQTGFMIPLSSTLPVDGYINPLQFYTLDFRQRKATYITTLDDSTFILVRQRIQEILNF